MLCCAVLCYAMLCYAMLCYVMLCYVMLCYVMLCYAMLCYVMLCYAMLCYAMLCYVMLCYAMLCYAMLCYAMLCYIKKVAVEIFKAKHNISLPIMKEIFIERETRSNSVFLKVPVNTVYNGLQSLGYFGPKVLYGMKCCLVI